MTMSWLHKGSPSVLGAAATGIFATVAVNSGDGLPFGNLSQLLIQFVAVLCSWVWAGGLTFVILKVLDATVGLRVPAEHELAGLDASIHGEPAWAVEI